MNKGISLIEMLIVLAIISIVLLIVFFNGTSVNTHLVLKEAADDITLSFRKAQIEGLAVLENPKSQNDFEVGYGVHFNLGNRGNNSALVYFVDYDPKNNEYDGIFNCTNRRRNMSNECLEVIEFDPRVSIKDICTISSRANYKCQSVNNGSVSAVFSRPRPEATITNGPHDDVYSVLITLEAVDGNTITVSLSASGGATIE